MTSALVPNISIITVVKNGVATIGEAIDSVALQEWQWIEHIVVDGLSTDGTQSVIAAHQHPRLTWISEPDSGLYEAMNKGIELSRGDWILFLGADDCLDGPKVLSNLFSNTNFNDCVLVLGTTTYHDGRSTHPVLDLRTRIFNTVHHQAAFYSRALFQGFRYRTDVSVIADYELNFIVHLHKFPCRRTSQRIALCGANGISQTASHVQAQLNGFKIRSRHIGIITNVFYLLIGLLNVATELVIARARTLWRSAKKPLPP